MTTPPPDDRTHDPATGSVHEHTPEEERHIREASLDETIADSFPASDPPSTDPNPDNHDAVRRDDLSS